MMVYNFFMEERKDIIQNLTQKIAKVVSKEVISLKNELDKKDKQILKLQTALEKKEAELEKVKKKLVKETGVDNPVKYVMDNYKDIYEKIVKISNKHGFQIFSKSTLCKTLITHLEGDKVNQPVSTKEEFILYLNEIDKYTLEQYRAIPYSPFIRSGEFLIKEQRRVTQLISGKSSLENTSSSQSTGFDFS